MQAEDQSAEPELGEAVRRGAPSLPAEAWSALDAVEAALLGPQEPPRVLAGRYEVRERIGAGGLGVVHRGYDRELDRVVAIKLVRRPDRDPDSIARQIHEARMLARVQHPNIVEIFDIVDDAIAHQVCIVMELVDGVDLRRWVQQGAHTPAEIVAVFVVAGTALAAAHELGVVHCDFKPSNVVIGRDARVRVLDFGLARSVARLDDAHTDGGSASSSSGPATTVGGTPVYMAPEQRRGVVGPAADQYAFCVSLYECLVGALPSMTDGDGGPRLHGRMLTALPRRLRRVLARGTEPEPERRFPSMHALLARLDRSRGAFRTAALGLAVLVVIAGSTFAIASREQPRECVLRSEGTWDDDVRAQVVSRLELLVDAADARAAASTFDDRWDDLAQGWTRACQADDAHSDARFTCLRRFRTRFGGLARAIVDGDANAAFAATTALGRDPGVAGCDAPDPNEVELGANAPLFDRLAEAEALCGSGAASAAAGLAIAVDVRMFGEQRDDARLLASANLIEGRCASATGRTAEGLEALERAVPAAQAAGNDRTTVKAAATLCTARAMEQQIDEAAHWCEVARAAAARGGDDPLLQGNVEGAWSALAFARNEHDVAREHIELAIAAWRRADRPDHLAVDLGNAAKLALSDNRPNDGRELIAEAIAIEREHGLLEGPQLAGRLHVLCGIEHVAGRQEVALGHCLEAWEILEHIPQQAPVVLAVAIATATVLEELSRHAEAIPFARAAIAAVEQTRGPDDPDMVLPLGLLGVALAHGSAEESAEAHVPAHRAVVLAESNFPSDHATVAAAYGDLGRVLHRQGKLDDAITALRRSSAIAEGAFGATNLDTLRAARSLAAVLVDRGECGEARPLLERVIAEQAGHDRAQTEALLERCAGQ